MQLITEWGIVVTEEVWHQTACSVWTTFINP